MAKELTTKQRYNLRKEQWQRVEQLATALRFKKAVDLAVAIGFQKNEGPRVFEFHYRAKKGERDYPREFWEAISTKFPEVNIDWLISGTGEMKIPQTKETTVNPSGDSFIMSGSSAMLDLIKPGDEVFVTPVELGSINVYGVPYRITSSDGIYVRLLYKGEKSGTFVLRSDEPSIMPDITIDQNNIRKVDRVRSLIRKFE